MNYVETELMFVPLPKPGKTASKSFGKAPVKKGSIKTGSELLGIKLRLGNRPLVYSLAELSHRSGKTMLSTPSSGQDYYLVVHAISALRTQGRARVEELQYFAAATEPAELQTIDLFPKTRFNQVVNASINLEAGLDLFGEVSLDVPSALLDELIACWVDMGPGLHLQLSASARFIGKFTFSLQVPVVQAAGVGSGACNWILRPNEEKAPLLGDQLLVQSIAVPKGTKKIQYNISGLVKADKGLFWKQQQLSTPEYAIEVQLNPTNTQQI
jgi:hypothetical protein